MVEGAVAAESEAVEGSAEHQGESQPQKDTVTQFIETLCGYVPADRASASVRATPHGLFVEQSYLPSIVEFFQDWFRKKTNNAIEINQTKCLKKFFNTATPPLFYLVESKQCMVGHLIRREFKQPQLLRLPTYLGTVDDTRRLLHPRDPLLLCMTHLTMGQGVHGREFSLNTGRRTWSFTEKVLVEFARLVQRSPKLSAQFPERTGALRDSLKILVSALEGAHTVGKSQRIIVPARYRLSKDMNYICLGTLTFVADRDGKIVSCYEVGGRTLFRFIKSEFAWLFSQGGEKYRGSVEILSPRSRFLAQVQAHGQKLMVHPRAMIEFIRGVMREPLERSAMNERYSVRECVDEMASLLQTAAPIDRNKILRHVERIRDRSARYQVNGRWIFVTNRRLVLVACADRFQHHSSGQQRGGHRGRGHGRWQGGRR